MIRVKWLVVVWIASRKKTVEHGKVFFLWLRHKKIEKIIWSSMNRLRSHVRIDCFLLRAWWHICELDVRGTDIEILSPEQCSSEDDSVEIWYSCQVWYHHGIILLGYRVSVDHHIIIASVVCAWVCICVVSSSFCSEKRLKNDWENNVKSILSMIPIFLSSWN